MFPFHHKLFVMFCGMSTNMQITFICIWSQWPFRNIYFRFFRHSYEERMTRQNVNNNNKIINVLGCSKCGSPKISLGYSYHNISRNHSLIYIYILRWFKIPYFVLWTNLFIYLHYIMFFSFYTADDNFVG